jgi:hypothetical protein
MNQAHDRHATQQPRRGVSALEFIGCASAMIGGVFLGSLYLGVDVKEMAYCALEHAQVIDKQTPPVEQASAIPVPSEAAATSAEAATTGSPAEETAGNDEAVAEAAPTVAAEPAAPVEPIPPAPAAGFFAREDLLTDAQRQALTLAYWEAVAACMQDEVAHRVPAIDADGNWQLFDYLTGRKDGHLRAAAAVAQLDARGVDDHVVAYAEKARAWHEDGGKLFGRAVDLLTDAPTAQLSGPFAQSWQSAATQHRMEERLLAEKYVAVKSYLDHAYPPAAEMTAEAATAQAGN